MLPLTDLDQRYQMIAMRRQSSVNDRHVSQRSTNGLCNECGRYQVFDSSIAPGIGTQFAEEVAFRGSHERETETVEIRDGARSCHVGGWTYVPQAAIAYRGYAAAGIPPQGVALQLLRSGFYFFLNL
jgi:hypothetical protein